MTLKRLERFFFFPEQSSTGIKYIYITLKSSLCREVIQMRDYSCQDYLHIESSESIIASENTRREFACPSRFAASLWFGSTTEVCGQKHWGTNKHSAPKWLTFFSKSAKMPVRKSCIKSWPVEDSGSIFLPTTVFMKRADKTRVHSFIRCLPRLVL